MRTRTICLFCLVFLGFELRAQAPRRRPQPQADAQEQPANLRGTVVNALTGEPIARAEVKVTKWGGEPRAFGALTTPEGKFSITGMPPGDYGVRAERPAFTMPRDEWMRAQPPLKLAAGENRDDFKLALLPCGSITGRVLDSAGEPVEFVYVAIEGGQAPGGARTDDEGRFRLGGLPPGKYRVRATPVEPQMQPEIRTDGTEETHHVPTYYPGSLNAKGASRVQVQAGRETGGIDIRLVRMPIVRVSGRVAGMPPNSNALVQTMTRSGSVMPVRVKPDGSFEIWRPMPGKYALSAVVMSPIGENSRAAPVEVAVSDTSIEGIVLSFAPPIDISGRVEEDGTPPSGPVEQSAQGESRSGRAFPRDVTLLGTLRFGPGGWAGIGADGTFALKRVQPDRYRVSLSLPQGYLKSIRVGQVETEGPVLDLRHASGDTEVTLVIGYGRVEVSGTVRSDGDVAGTLVALRPDDNDAFGGGPSYMATAGRDGAYSLSGIPPGRYKVLAIAPEQRMDFELSRDLEAYEDFIETVELKAGEKTTKDLRKYAEEEK